ncbi:MAG: hypothetical protein KDC07_06340, partial [Chitinophagaceae bacterium]|nr:hypothetical protein [Chitinophagaceae bacterium]
NKIFIGVEWPGLYDINKDLMYKVGPKVLRAQSISENRSFYRSEKTAGWLPMFYSEKRPGNIMVSADYLLE